MKFIIFNDLYKIQEMSTLKTKWSQIFSTKLFHKKLPYTKTIYLRELFQALFIFKVFGMYQASAPSAPSTQQTRHTDWEGMIVTRGRKQRRPRSVHQPHPPLPTQQGLCCGSRRQMTATTTCTWDPGPVLNILCHQGTSQEISQGILFMYVHNIKIYLWPPVCINSIDTYF